MLIEQIIQFELKRPGFPGRTCIPTTSYLYDKAKITKENLGMNYYLLLKYWRMRYLTFLFLGQITYKI